MNHLTKIDMDMGNQGKLRKADLQEGIKTFLTDVDEETLNGMVRAAELEMEDKESDEIEYKNLFMEVSRSFHPYTTKIRKNWTPKTLL